MLGFAVLGVEDREPHRAVRNEIGNIHGRSLVDSRQVLADGSPLGLALGRPVPPSELDEQMHESVVGDGGVTETILTEDLQRHTLPHLGGVERVIDDGQVGVGVHVNEARADHEPRDVDLRSEREVTPWRDELADPAVFDADGPEK